MTRWQAQARRAARSVACVLVYVGVLAANPLLHHDLACHVKTPTHCDACTASPMASRPEPGPTLRPAVLSAVGRVEDLAVGRPALTSSAPHAGRSPPRNPALA